MNAKTTLGELLRQWQSWIQQLQLQFGILRILFTLISNMFIWRPFHRIFACVYSELRQIILNQRGSELIPYDSVYAVHSSEDHSFITEIITFSLKAIGWKYSKVLPAFLCEYFPGTPRSSLILHNFDVDIGPYHHCL